MHKKTMLAHGVLAEREGFLLRKHFAITNRGSHPSLSQIHKKTMLAHGALAEREALEGGVWDCIGLLLVIGFKGVMVW